MQNLKSIFVDPLKNVDIYALVGDAIEKNADVLNELNQQQLDRGLDSKGKSLGRYKNFNYKNRFEPVDLLNTGAWRGKFTVSSNKKQKKAEMFSQDVKEDKLVKRYGPDIHGVSAQNLPTAEDAIKPDLQDLYKNAVISNAK